MQNLWEYGCLLIPTIYDWIGGGAIATVAAVIVFILDRRKHLTMWPRSAIWLAVALSMLVLAVSYRGFAVWRQTAESLKEANKSLDSKNDRAFIRGKLGEFYVDGTRLASGGNVRNGSPLDEIIKAYVEYRAEVSAWENRVQDWMRENMAKGAAERFSDVSSYFSRDTYIVPQDSINPDHAWTMNVVKWKLRNISMMMESDAWYKQ